MSKQDWQHWLDHMQNLVFIRAEIAWHFHLSHAASSKSWAKKKNVSFFVSISSQTHIRNTYLPWVVWVHGKESLRPFCLKSSKFSAWGLVPVAPASVSTHHNFSVCLLNSLFLIYTLGFFFIIIIIAANFTEWNSQEKAGPAVFLLWSQLSFAPAHAVVVNRKCKHMGNSTLSVCFTLLFSVHTLLAFFQARTY